MGMDMAQSLKKRVWVWKVWMRYWEVVLDEYEGDGVSHLMS